MDFNAILADVVRQAKMIGIPVSNRIHPRVELNTRAKKRYGRCIYKDGNYTIELSAYLSGVSLLLVHEVIAHEVLHTCPGCMNHGSLWKRYAELMGERYGYQISRTAKEPLVPEKTAPTQSVRTRLQCAWRVQKRTDFAS